MKKIFYIAFLLTLIAGVQVQAQKNTKSVSSEANVSKGSLIRIVGANRKLNIKSWDQSKVKVTMQVMVDSMSRAMTDEEWIERLGISIKPFSNRVDILANRTGNAGSLNAVTVVGYSSKLGQQQRAADIAYVDALRTTSPGRQVTGQTFRPGGTDVTPTPNVVLSLDIMIPAGSKLDIDNQYGDVTIAMNLDEAKLDISNGALDMQDVKNLELIGKYCNANFGSIEKAEVEFQNGTFHANNIGDLDLDSKYSTVEYEKGKYLFMRSQADHITIDEIEKVDGRKTYGSIRIDMLNGDFDLDGNNVDIKIRNINPQVEMIKINNKYGDVRLPVKTLKNYFVEFRGYYSTVFTPFQKTIIKEEEKKTPDNGRSEQELLEVTMTGELYISSSALAGEIAPSRFTGSVGDVSGKHTRFQLTCHSCTVDFK